MSFIDPIDQTFGGSRYLVDGVEFAYWSRTIDDGMSLVVTDSHNVTHARIIPKKTILAWTNEKNDALEEFALAGLDFSQNHQGARQLIKDYLRAIGEVRHKKVKIADESIRENFRAQAEEPKLSEETPFSNAIALWTAGSPKF